MNTESDVEEARARDRDLSLRIIAVLVPVILALSGWVVSLEGRLQEVKTKQEERGPRISALEAAVKDLEETVRDPAPKPETKVAVENIISQHRRLEERVDRMEERINALHNYLLMLPRPPFKGKRGDALQFSPIYRGGG